MLLSTHLSQIILPLLHWLMPHATTGMLEAIHVAVRKRGHIFECFVFGLLLPAVHAAGGAAGSPETKSPPWNQGGLSGANSRLQ